MNQKHYTIVILTGIIFVFVLFAHADQKGAADMVLNGGKTGNVPFPHSRHQTALDAACGSCHELFPKEKDSVDRLKTEGALAQKSIMNHCIACHKNTASKGAAAGPVKCKECHRL